MDGQQSYVRSRLSAMMFLQFFIWGTWFVPVGGYIINALKFEGYQISGIFATTALGAIFAPLIVGYVADRYFPTERVLCVLHLIGGVCLFLAAILPQTFLSLMSVLMIHTLCFMPTLALANSLAFRNIDDPDKFPRIAMFGTVGWIVGGLLVGFLLGETRPWFFILAGSMGIVMGVYSLTLPHTPPKGREASVDVLGLRALKLLREPSYLIFVISAFLIAIPATFYFVGCNAMLVGTDRPVPTALMTLGQVTEIVVMFTMPWLIAQLGLRKILALGMLTWTIRYLLFATLSFPLILVGVLVHGFGYCFVFVGAYIYVDKRAPRELRASAQSFIAFLMLGVGWLVGSLLGGLTVNHWYPPAVEGVADTPTISKLAQTIDTDKDGQITSAELERIPAGGLKLKDKTYAKKDLTEFFRKVDDQKEIRTKADVRAAVDGEIRITRSDWLQAQSNRWPPIWLWPAAGAALIGAFFWLASREEKPAAEAKEAAQEGKKEPQEEPAAGETEQGSQPEGESAGQ